MSEQLRYELVTIDNARDGDEISEVGLAIAGVHCDGGVGDA